jgi:hypothetical protein
MGKIFWTVIGFIVAGAIGWLVSVLLSNATAHTSLDASDSEISYTSNSEIVTFDVANTGTKAAVNCTANLSYSVNNPAKGMVSTAPDVPSNGTVTFEIAYFITSQAKFAVGNVWAVCNGSVSQKIPYYASAPAPNQG